MRYGKKVIVNEKTLRNNKFIKLIQKYFVCYSYRLYLYYDARYNIIRTTFEAN